MYAPLHQLLFCLFQVPHLAKVIHKAVEYTDLFKKKQRNYNERILATRKNDGSSLLSHQEQSHSSQALLRFFHCNFYMYIVLISHSTEVILVVDIIIIKRYNIIIIV